MPPQTGSSPAKGADVQVASALPQAVNINSQGVSTTPQQPSQVVRPAMLTGLPMTIH